eukprot:218700-Alexandrium_andersonii.AAC.1
MGHHQGARRTEPRQGGPEEGGELPHERRGHRGVARASTGVRSGAPPRRRGRARYCGGGGIA